MLTVKLRRQNCEYHLCARSEKCVWPHRAGKVFRFFVFLLISHMFLSFSFSWHSKNVFSTKWLFKTSDPISHAWNAFQMQKIWRILKKGHYFRSTCSSICTLTIFSKNPRKIFQWMRLSRAYNAYHYLNMFDKTQKYFQQHPTLIFILLWLHSVGTISFLLAFIRRRYLNIRIAVMIRTTASSAFFNFCQMQVQC